MAIPTLTEAIAKLTKPQRMAIASAQTAADAALAACSAANKAFLADPKNDALFVAFNVATGTARKAEAELARALAPARERIGAALARQAKRDRALDW